MRGLVICAECDLLIEVSHRIKIVSYFPVWTELVIGIEKETTFKSILFACYSCSNEIKYLSKLTALTLILLLLYQGDFALSLKT